MRLVRPEVVALQAFDLAAEPFSYADDLRLFGLNGDALAFEDAEHILPNIGEKAFRPATSGYGHMHVRTLETVEDHAVDDPAISLRSHRSIGRAKSLSDSIA